MPTDYKKFSGKDLYRSSDTYERVRQLAQKFDRYEEYYRPEIDRWVLNSGVAWGLNFKQWPSMAVEKLIAQGRRPPTFNIIGKKIESQVSHFMSNGFDMKCYPANGRIDSLVQKANQLYLSDKNFMQWKISQRVALRDMFIMVGYERMYIDDRQNSMGNIGWEAVCPGHIYLSPSWKSQSCWDIPDYFDWTDLFVSEICEMFPEVKDKLKDIREREEREGVNLGEYHGGPQNYRNVEEKWGAKHKVMTFHHIKKEDEWWEYDLKNMCNFPETGFKNQSQEDRQVKWQYAQDAGLGPDDIKMMYRQRRVKYIEVFCPELDVDMMLRNGKDKIQTNNCNIYPLGNGYNGQFKGTVDDLYDIQISFNKGRMNIDDIQLSTAKGACLLDRRLAGGDPELEQKIEENWNIPGAKMWVDEGAMAELGPTGGVIPIPRIPPTPDTYNENSRLLDLADWFSTVPASMDSRTENNQESGTLYRSKMQVAVVGQRYGMEIWEAHEQSKAMAYLLQAKITYAGWPRTFNMPGQPPARINSKVDTFNPETGEVKREMIDDISKLPEMQVLMIPSQQGTTIQESLQKQYGAQIQLVAKDPQFALVYAVTLEALYATFPTPDDKKAELEKAFAMTKKLIATNMAASYKQTMAMMNPQPQVPQQGPEAGPPKQISAQPPTEEQAVAGTPMQDRVPISQ